MNSLQNMYKGWDKRFVSILIFSIIPLLHYARFSYILGSKSMFFSLNTFVMPVLGLYASWAWLGVAFVSRSLFLWTNPLYSALYSLPGFMAALSLKTESWVCNIVVPMLCMGLFMVHPVAGQVWVYSLYWLIPVVLHSMEYGIYPQKTDKPFFRGPRKPSLLSGVSQTKLIRAKTVCAGFINNYIVRALRATFVAHAVGSVVWAYCKPMTVAQWQLLIPVVPVERCTFAIGMVLCQLVFEGIAQLSMSYRYNAQKNSAIQ